jgi:hypothetical protein
MRSSKWLVFIRSLLAGFHRSLTPFHSDDEMVEQHIRNGLDAQMKFDMIERTAAKMPKAYGDAFRYIAYRDLNERMEMYLEIAKERIQPKAGTPHLATVAHSA